MNTKQYNDLVDEQADPLMRFACFILKDKTESQDIVQESFTRVWENRKKIDQKTAKSYLFTIAHNLAISSCRTNQRHGTVSITAMIENQKAGEDRGYDNQNEIVWQEMEKLPPISKSLIMLRDWEGYSYQEIAEITSLTDSQVKIGIHRARTKLKEQLAKIL